ncbi:MAG: GNAT family N-acetyltransferase [Phormidesmis sp. RL_2_1]|nr:GNAT family N-acetyltransferase [Phormidesmis sp. RL_2_1]
MAFVPPDFAVPMGLETSEFRLRMLTIHDVVKDYEAVMTSREQLQGVFGPHSSWPTADLSLEQDLIDLGWHQKEFQNRTSFAYTVMSLDETRCLGCVYLYPAAPVDYDAQVILWARQSELVNGLEERLLQTLKPWLSKVWPFEQVAFPGREIDWDQWLSLA